MSKFRVNWVFPLILVLCLSISFNSAQAAPGRIVSLAPSVTENLFALGVGDRIVGVTSWCDYPLEAAEKTVIGDAMSLNLELLLSLEPDLVVGDSTIVASYLETLQGLGIKTFVVGPTTVAEVRQSLIDLGEAVGSGERGRQLALAMEERQAELVKSVGSRANISVFVEIWNDPLMTAGPGSFIDELIALAGGKNIAHDAQNPWPTFSEELVIERDPQVLILTCYNLEEVLGRSAWKGISAFKKNDIYQVNPDLYARTTPRLLDALQELISILDEAAS